MEDLFGLICATGVYLSGLSFMFHVARSKDMGPQPRLQALIAGALWPVAVPLLGAIAFVVQLNQWFSDEKEPTGA